MNIDKRFISDLDNLIESTYFFSLLIKELPEDSSRDDILRVIYKLGAAAVKKREKAVKILENDVIWS